MTLTTTTTKTTTETTSTSTAMPTTYINEITTITNELPTELTSFSISIFQSTSTKSISLSTSVPETITSSTTTTSTKTTTSAFTFANNPVHLLNTFDSNTNGGHTGRIRALARFSSNENNFRVDGNDNHDEILISGADDSQIKLWNLSEKSAQTPLIHTFNVLSEVRAIIAIRAVGFLFASGSLNGDIKIWNASSLSLTHEFLNG